VVPHSLGRRLCLSPAAVRQPGSRREAGVCAERLVSDPFSGRLPSSLRTPNMSSPPSASFGAVTMGDKRYRKACDRCHLHKQSCTRANEDRCDRCAKLGAECMISLSEKQAKQYQKQPKPQPKQQKPQQAQKKKQHPQQLLQQHQPHQREQEPTPAFLHNGKLPPSRPQVTVTKEQQQRASYSDSASVSVSVSTTAPDPRGTSDKTAQVRSRSPKRRRTDSDPSLVLPDAGRYSSYLTSRPPSCLGKVRDCLNTDSLSSPKQIPQRHKALRTITWRGGLAATLFVTPSRVVLSRTTILVLLLEVTAAAVTSHQASAILIFVLSLCHSFPRTQTTIYCSLCTRPLPRSNLSIIR
jgi:hypothetical protein